VQAVGHASRERDEAVKQAAESRIAVEQIERRMEWIMAGLTQRLISADELHLLWTPGGGQRGAA
jgi:hypothetical protein